MRKFIAFHLASLALSAVADPASGGTGAPAEAPAETKPAAPAKIQANGVTRPAPGTKTGRVWEIADELSKAAGKPIPRKDVMEKGEKEGINAATIATQYGKWRVFNGLKGVVTTEPKPPKEKKAKTPAAGAEAPVTEGAAPAAAPTGAAA